MMITIRRFGVLMSVLVLLQIICTTSFARAEQSEIEPQPTTTSTTAESQSEVQEVSPSSSSSSSYISNPIQVRFESFSIELGPTNNARPLSIKDADTILGMIEDLITNFARKHYYHNNNIVISTNTAGDGISTASTVSSLRARGEENSNDEVAETRSRDPEGDEDNESTPRTAAKRNGGEDSDEDGIEFKYAILGLVSIARHPEEYRSRTTTTLDFPTGGIAYFGGGGYPPGGSAGPTPAEVQMLVTLALNEGDLVDSLQTEFPYINEATYRRWSSEEEIFNNEEEEEKEEGHGGDPKTDGEDNDNNDGPDSLMDSPVASDNEQQFMIIVISACGAALVFCMLLVVLYLIRQRQRRVFWREDNHRQNGAGGSNNHGHHLVAKSPLPPQRDAALDHDDSSLDYSYPNNTNNKTTPTSKRFSLHKNEAKQQSLHLRDSLRGMTIMQDQDINDPHPFGDSAVAAEPASCDVVDDGVIYGGGDVEKEKPPPSPLQDGHAMNLNPDQSGDQDTSSCSRSSNDSVHDKEYDTCPSDFEGNAIVKPNLLPVTNLDRFSDDDPHNPLPPSQTSAARHDDSLIELSVEEVGDVATASAQSPTHASAAIPGGPTLSLARLRNTQEGFLAKYFNPILPLGSVGLSYFSSTTHDDDDAEEDDGNEADCEAPYYQTPRYQKQDHLTPRTAVSTLSPPGDQDSRWSDVSSDAYKTDDENFEPDRAWDPDDTSVTSSADGKDIFSPCSSDDNDEVKLLDSLGGKAGTSYNLHKLRTPTKPKAADATRNNQDVADTEDI